MRLLLLGIALALGTSGCSKKNSTDCKGNVYTYTFSANRQIRDTTVSNGIGMVPSLYQTTGTQLVFNYKNSQNPCNTIAPGYTQLIYFMIDPSLSSFDYTDSSLQVTRCYVLVFGEVFRNTPAIIVKGEIKGNKVFADRWNITVNVQTPFGDTVSFNKIFVYAP